MTSHFLSILFGISDERKAPLDRQVDSVGLIPKGQSPNLVFFMSHLKLNLGLDFLLLNLNPYPQCWT